MANAPEKNDRFIGFSLAVAQLPAVDMQTPREIRARIARYFKLCGQWDMKPSLSGLAVSLGMDRRRFLDCCAGGEGVGKLPDECAELLRGAHRVLELLWEQFLLEGQIGATPGIFLGKNHFAYQDRAELAVEPARPADEHLSEEELANRARRLRAGVVDDEE